MARCNRQRWRGKLLSGSRSPSGLWLFVTFSFLSSLTSALGQATAPVSGLERLSQHYDAARTFQLSGDLEHATTEYRAFLREALRGLANANAQMGELNVATRLFDDVLRLAPEDQEARLDYAFTRLQQGRLPEARALAEMVLQASPE